VERRGKKVAAVCLALVLILILFTTSMLDMVEASGKQSVIYISPKGNDANDGTFSAPFATLERARDAIRSLKSSGDWPKNGLRVYLREGEYSISRTFELNEQDSGTATAPVIYENYRGEEVRLVGGAVLSPQLFERVTDPAILQRLPGSSRESVVQFDLHKIGIETVGEIKQTGFNLPITSSPPELFFNNESMTLARWPNDGFVEVGEVKDSGSNPRLGDNSNRGAIFSYSDERPERWSSLDDVWMFGYWFFDWADGNLRIDSIDKASNQIKTAQPSFYSVKSDQRYYYYNILEELDSPGEWYLDRTSGKLYFYPPSPIKTGAVQLSLLKDSMITMNKVSYVKIQGLTFEASQDAAIRMTGGSNNLIANNIIRNMGTFALVIKDGQQHGVIENKIYNIGTGAIYLGGGNRAALTKGEHYVENNEIFNFSRLKTTYSPAIELAGVGNRIAHNEIYDAQHMAILIHGNDHIIEFNDIHDVLKETSDAGAIYMGRDWTERGNIIRYNYLHDLRSIKGIGQIGVYLDDMASESYVYGNIFNNVNRAMLVGGGRSNKITNNMILSSDQSVTLDNRGMNWSSNSCAPNGILPLRLKSVPYESAGWRSAYPELVTTMADEPCVPKYNTIQQNLIYQSPQLNIAKEAVTFGKISDNWLSTEDPGFVDAANQNFALRKDAAVFKQIPGFEPIPFDKIGIVSGKPGWKDPGRMPEIQGDCTCPVPPAELDFKVWNPKGNDKIK